MIGGRSHEEDRGADPYEGGGSTPGRESDNGRSTSSRIQSIIDAAQSAAEGILRDAEEQGRKRIEESKQRAEELAADRVNDIYKVTDSLVEQARQVRERSGELVRALDDAIRHVERTVPADLDDADARDGATVRERVTSTLRAERDRLAETTGQLSGSADVEETPAEQPAPEPQIPNEARVLAARMAIAGSSRKEIRRQLRSDYGIADPEPVLDEILGPE